MAIAHDLDTYTKEVCEAIMGSITSSSLGLPLKSTAIEEWNKRQKCTPGVFQARYEIRNTDICSLRLSFNGNQHSYEKQKDAMIKALTARDQNGADYARPDYDLEHSDAHIGERIPLDYKIIDINIFIKELRKVKLNDHAPRSSDQQEQVDEDVDILEFPTKKRKICGGFLG
ncbi:hypothetical protein CC78DRAFT_573345 [Lojkania enalia]|uniref:Uncharacterized protein n=1 Tax=Lojkania enalia TaxID=147567 RepID=A0A9P4ND08_9PLEO|nr:hypothetical protein CC78DRAFT_573345 [Didymosphaeria enalia]